MKHPRTKAANIRLTELSLPVSGLDIWWVPLPDIEYNKLLADFSGCLSAEERQRLQTRRLPKGQFQFVFTRVVLRHLLSSYHPATNPVQWKITRSESGRPHLSPEQTSLSFNLTHTEDCLLIAFSQYADPGVDVERQSRAAEFDGVARRFFSAQEYAELQQRAEADRSEYFLRLWTLKEAAVKASGLGLARGLRQFQFSRVDGNAFLHETQVADFQFWSSCFQGYVVAAALMGEKRSGLPDIEPVTRRFDWPDVVEVISPGWIKSQSRNSSTNLEP